jgi:outer membrane protein assembly factor BamB
MRSRTFVFGVIVLVLLAVFIGAVKGEDEPLNLLWKKDIKNANAVAINEGIVAIVDENSNLHVFDLNGTFLWSSEGGLSLDIGQGMIVVGSERVTAFDFNGSKLWMFKGEEGLLLARFKVAIGKDRIAAPQDRVALFVLDFSGKVLWKNETIGKTSYYFDAVATDSNIIVVASVGEGNLVHAFDYDGNELWELTDDASKIVIEGDKILLGHSLLDLSGNIFWKKDIGSKPVLHRGGIVCGNTGAIGAISAFDLRGNRLWEYRLWEHSFGNPYVRDLAVHNNLLLVATNGAVGLFRINYIPPVNITVTPIQTEAPTLSPTSPTLTQTEVPTLTSTPLTPDFVASASVISLIVAFIIIIRRSRK